MISNLGSSREQPFREAGVRCCWCPSSCCRSGTTKFWKTGPWRKTRLFWNRFESSQKKQHRVGPHFGGNIIFSNKTWENKLYKTICKKAQGRLEGLWARNTLHTAQHMAYSAIIPRPPFSFHALDFQQNVEEAMAAPTRLTAMMRKRSSTETPPSTPGNEDTNEGLRKASIAFEWFNTETKDLQIST